MTKNTKSIVLPLTLIYRYLIRDWFRTRNQFLISPGITKIIRNLEYGFLSDYRCDIHSFSSFRLSCRTHN